MNVKEFNQAVDLYSDGVYRFVLKNIKDEDKAKDIVQDTYEKLWKKHSEVNYEKVKSYLFSTAYHTLIDLTRREKKQARWEEVDDNRHSFSDGYSDLNEVLHQAVDRLPDIQKMVVMLRDYEGYSYKEIGDLTKLTESQVKVYIFRARKFLKDYIGKMEVVV
ncbi:RNA polymerase sigma factor [Carboxylicivirga caseinilyticus]|uniref:RNA polymerase sigma factor n=1 Tax=Carboxylicivirga caseinilyticus TaxID=3417572 RepID=UPI002AA684D0|nr:RNA polymerase sigma factor [uncultured Carboxylicivirga sp.]MCU4162564.1 RNA polymerase sigma factor [Marinilabiliaceae bacterium A049]